MKFSAIIIFIGLLIVGSTMYFAIQYSDGEVTTDHYEKGLEYDRHRVDKEKLGLSIEIEEILNKDGKVNLTYKLKANDGVVPEKMQIAVVRPGTAFETYTLDIKNTEHSYSLSFNTEKSGHFLLKNDFYIDGNFINLKKNFYVN